MTGIQPFSRRTLLKGGAAGLTLAALGAGAACGRGGGSGSGSKTLKMLYFGEQSQATELQNRLQPEITKLDPGVTFEIAAINGTDKLESITLRDTVTGDERPLEVTGLFIAIGHDPRSELLTGQVDLDDEGYVQVEQPSTATNLPGVFAAGDLVDHQYRQAITAAGTGCAAALDAERYLAALDHEASIAGSAAQTEEKVSETQPAG